MSADTWTMVTTWFRNTLLNQAILLPAGVAALLLPYLLVYVTQCFIKHRTGSERMGIGALTFAMIVIGINIGSLHRSDEKRKAFQYQQSGIQILVVLPLLVAAWMLSTVLWSWHFVPQPSSHTFLPAWLFAFLKSGHFANVFVVVFCMLLVLSVVGRYDRLFYGGQATGAKAKAMAKTVLVNILTALVGTLLVFVLAEIYERFSSGLWHVFVFGTPLLLLAFSLVISAHLGLMGRNFPDEGREWWSRLAAFAVIYNIAWVLICVGSLYGAWFMAKMNIYWSTLLSAAWVLSTVGGTLAARSPLTANNLDRGLKTKSLGLLAQVGPYIFIVGLILLLSLGIHCLLIPVQGGAGVNEWFEALAAQNAVGLASVKYKLIAELCFGCILVAWFLSWRIDLNEFSMHHFYKNRLVRCYLGASRLQIDRRANPFSGFDPKDEWDLRQFSNSAPNSNSASAFSNYTGPYAIMNASLNLVRGDELAWQERKAESFIFTPRYCGYEHRRHEHQNWKRNRSFREDGYRPTERYAYPDSGGIKLGTATAISGAAANPNMGYNSSPGAGFLMTVFNVRLGWWLGNTRHTKTWKRSDPRVGILYLFNELTGGTTDESGYINISDGGHFENLGVYELVRRRCRYIIACDASHDPEFHFEDLGNTIRKCRTDFGVDINIRVDRIRPDAQTKRSAAHCAVGTITYPDGNGGYLLYVKPSLTGDESSDVLEYANRCAAFPHETTADQWFNESRFESYRDLGFHIVSTVLERADLGQPLKDVFEELRDIWYPPSGLIEKYFTKHAEAYEDLMERVRRDPELAFMDRMLFPDFTKVVHRRTSSDAIPPSETARRSAFYIFNALIQLMENVYLDLNLERECDQPHNEGWIRLFKYWFHPEMMQKTWRATRNTYGKRFQVFCQRKLFPCNDTQPFYRQFANSVARLWKILVS